MTILEIQPWGRSPTPLLPKSLIVELGHTSAPPFLIDAVGPQATLGDLNGVWEHIDSINNKSLTEITSLIRPLFSSRTHLSIRAGESLRLPIQDMPFSNRTRNCVSQYLEKFTAHQLSFRDVLSVPGFGVRSAIEFACVVEVAMIRASEASLSDTSEISLDPRVSVIPQEIKSSFQMLAAYAAGERNMGTFAGVLPEPVDNWPPEIKHLWGSMNQISTREIAGDLIKRYAVPDLMSRALVPLDTRLREILAKRVFTTEHAITLEVLGKRMGITRERVRQLEKKAISHLKRLENSEFCPVVRRAQIVRAKLGVGLPTGDVSIQNTLDWATVDISKNSNISPEFARALLLWLAGPYKNKQGWLLAKKHLKRLTLEAILDRRNDRGMVTDEVIEEILTQFGFIRSVHQDWLNLLRDFLSVDGGYIYFKGSIPEKVKTLLRFYGRPIAIGEIMDILGSDSIRSVKQRLIDDSGLWRINKQSEFVIAGTPDYDEYTGITDEIVQEIEACGGEAAFDHLIEKLGRVYGVKESSVAVYINTQMFTKDENGIVRIRDSDTAISVTTDIAKTAACYRGIDGSWLWRVLIDKDIVRGSGRLVPNAFAQEVGCSIGDKIEISTTEGFLTFSWQLASPSGASIGSLRPALVSCGAELGDYLFIRATKPELSFECLSKNTLESAQSVFVRLCLLVGAGLAIDDDEAERRIADALGIVQDPDSNSLMELRRIFNARGESDLAEIIPLPDLSMDEYVANIGKLLDR